MSSKIPTTSVSGTNGLANFPVLINRTDTNWKYTGCGGHVASATGWDFVITAADGVTKLDHEIESHASSTGAFVGWVRYPFLSATTTNLLYVYYGNSGAANTTESERRLGFHLPRGLAPSRKHREGERFDE